MSSNCGCPASCGCGGNNLSQAPTCSFPSCENAESCAEIIFGQCVRYTGEQIVNLDIPKGASFNDIIQYLVGYLTNPGCNSTASVCRAVLFKLDSSTKTTLTFSWGAVSSATGYRLQWSTDNVSWTNQNPLTTDTSDTIGNLTANTVYYVRVVSVCSSGGCNSVTLKVTTKA